jgi:DNA-binding transcriptional LysR family regulator
LFAPELNSGAVQAVLTDWLLPRVDLWALFPTGRQASAKARAFASFVESQMSISGFSASGLGRE